MALRPPSLLSLPCMRTRARVALRVSPPSRFTCFRCGCRAPRRARSMGERPCTEADVRASLLDAQPAFRFPDGRTENDFVPEFFAGLLRVVGVEGGYWLCAINDVYLIGEAAGLPRHCFSPRTGSGNHAKFCRKRAEDNGFVLMEDRTGREGVYLGRWSEKEWSARVDACGFERVVRFHLTRNPEVIGFAPEWLSTEAKAEREQAVKDAEAVRQEREQARLPTPAAPLRPAVSAAASASEVGGRGFNSAASMMMAMCGVAKQERLEHDPGRRETPCFFTRKGKEITHYMSNCMGCGHNRPTTHFSNSQEGKKEILCIDCYAEKREKIGNGRCLCCQCMSMRMDVREVDSADVFKKVKGRFDVRDEAAHALLAPYEDMVTRPPRLQGGINQLRASGVTPVAEKYWDVTDRREATLESPGRPIFATLKEMKERASALLDKAEGWGKGTIVFAADTRDEGFDGKCGRLCQAMRQTTESAFLYFKLDGNLSLAAVYFMRVQIALVLDALVPRADLVYLDTDTVPLSGNVITALKSIAFAHRTTVTGMADAGSQVNSGIVFLQANLGSARSGGCDDDIESWASAVVTRLYENPKAEDLVWPVDIEGITHENATRIGAEERLFAGSHVSSHSPFQRTRQQVVPSCS